MTKAKLLSNNRGEITRVLLVDRFEIEEKIDSRKVLGRLRGIIDALTATHETRTITFEIILQHDFDAKEDFMEVPIEDSNDPIQGEDEFHYAHLFKRLGESGNGKQYYYRLIRPNIDFKVLRTLGKVKDDNCNIKDDESWLGIWARDPFLVMESSGGIPILLKPYHSWPTEDDKVELSTNHFIPEIVGSQMEVYTKSVPFFMQGGNVLASGNFALIGKDIFEKNRKMYNEKLSTAYMGRFLPTLERVFGGLKVHCIERNFPDSLWDAVKRLFYHLDLYVTLAGPIEGNRETVFVAQLMQWHASDSGEGKWGRVPSEGSKIQHYLDLYAGELSRTLGDGDPGVDVFRLPLLQEDNVYYSYNNCLVEHPGRGETPRIYLPQFDWPEIDRPHNPDLRTKFLIADEMAKKWVIDAKFQPIMVEMGFRAMAGIHAGLDCMTCVVSRSKE